MTKLFIRKYKIHILIGSAILGFAVVYFSDIWIENYIIEKRAENYYAVSELFVWIYLNLGWLMGLLVPFLFFVLVLKFIILPSERNGTQQKERMQKSED